MKFSKKMAKRNTTELRGELSRAHLIISLLALIAIVLLTVGSTMEVGFDANLSAIASAFLALLAIVSLCISYNLFKNKK